MIISIIVAKTQNNVIGYRNTIPWHLPKDLQHFKKLTLHKYVIMGRKTWESLPCVLVDRKMIILTNDSSYVVQGGIIAHSLKDALAIAKQADSKEVFIAGGGGSLP